MSDIISWLINIANSFGGYLGIFIISILGNLIPFIPIPYLVAVYLYSAYIPGSNPVLVGMVSGLGGGLGKLIVFVISYGASHLVPEEKMKQFITLKKMLGNYGALAVFIFAATPSPDDVVIALLGIMRYNVTKFFVSVTLGKIVISILTAYLGKSIVIILGEENFWYSLIISIAIFTIAMIVITLLDWMKIMENVTELGWRGFLKRIRERGVEEFIISARRKRDTKCKGKSS